jgi:hypothetical protein
MIAGNDVDYAMPTIARTKRLLEPDITDPDDVAMLLHEQMVETRKRKIESRILSKFGLTVDTFLQSGKTCLTDSVYFDLISQISREDLSITLLLAGFDSSQQAHLRIVTADDSPLDRDMLGFAAIGTGAPSACGSLAFAVDHCGFGKHTNVESASYHVLAAKFMSESATDVGRDTFYISLDVVSGCTTLFPFGSIEAIRKAWEKHGAPRESPLALKVVKDLLLGPKQGPFDIERIKAAQKHITGSDRRMTKQMTKQLLSAAQKVLSAKNAAKLESSTPSDSQTPEGNKQ